MAKEHSVLNVLKEIEAISSSGYKEMASHLPKDRGVIGFFCPYVPEELVHAAGAVPFRLMETPIKMSHVRAHLPPNCCHLVKSSLESLLQGELDFLKGIIFSHTCDSMQGLADIWAHQRRTPLQFNLMMPSHLDSQFSRPYLKAEIERFKSFLESNVGSITPQSLEASIQLFNHIREKLQEIYNHRSKGHAQIAGCDFARMVRAGYLMDRQRYLELLTDLLSALPEKTEESENLVPIYLTGNMTHSDSYFSLIEEAGAFAIVLEKIPAQLATKVTRTVRIPTIGIGAGRGCDGQVLVVSDMLGMNEDFHPRFVRHYGNLAEDIRSSVGRYVREVKERAFPANDESY